ncbi:MAG: hypothetical protein WAL29_03350 [Bacteroidales bacterium]
MIPSGKKIGTLNKTNGVIYIITKILGDHQSHCNQLEIRRITIKRFFTTNFYHTNMLRDQAYLPPF